MSVPKTAVLVVVAAFAIALSIRSVGRRYLFPRQDIAVIDPPPSVELWAFRASDGETVHALSVPSGKHGLVVVHFHNNRETMVEPLWLARWLTTRGLDVILAEYRGYGLSKSGAAPSEDGLYLDAEATLNELARRGYGAERVILWGTSLGSGVAAEMARRHRGAALVLVSPYTSIPDLVREHAWVSLPELLLPDRFDIASKAALIRIPTLIIHGDADEIVPFSMGARVAALIVGSTFVRIRAGRHGNLFALGGKPLLDRISSFTGSVQSIPRFGNYRI
jgi:alpha-beta hydrolase superfamily lysophospholipase